MIASARERVQLRGLSRGGEHRVGLHAVTYRYMIANKADGKAIPQSQFVQSEINRCTYLRYPAEKECTNPRSPVNCSFRIWKCCHTNARSTFCFHLDGLPFLPRSVGCAYAVWSREGQHDAFVFVCQLVVSSRLTAVVSAASLNCGAARSG